MHAAPFSALLPLIDATKLHALLHDCSPHRFQDGVYETDTTALEILHQHEPQLASAILELARRGPAVSNGTSAPGPIGMPLTLESSLAALPGPTLNPSSVPPNPVQGSATATARVTPQPQGSSAAPPPSSAAAVGGGGSSSRASVTAAAPPSVTGAVLQTFTVATASDGVLLTLPESIQLTTITLAGGRLTTAQVVVGGTSLVLLTATLPGGAVSTITAQTVVGVPGLLGTDGPAGSSVLAGAASSSRASGALVNFAAGRSRGRPSGLEEILGGVLGAVAGVVMWF